MRMKLGESGLKTLEAVSRTLQIHAMYEAESCCGKGRSFRVVQESSKGETSELVELLKQNMVAMNQMVNFVQQQQQQQPSSNAKRNGQGLGPNASCTSYLFGSVSSAIKGHSMADCKQTSAAAGGNKS